jgi:hypothetical protein
VVTIFSLIKEIIEPTRDYQEVVSDIIDQGGEYKGKGDYGSVYLLNGKAVKVTTDEVELEHAQILKGKNTENFTHVFDVDVRNPKLGIITMDVLIPYNGEIPQDFINSVEQEAEQLGIDREELDIRPSNIMIDAKGHLKMIDV